MISYGGRARHLIITGLSGAGKSFAIHALEDNGFFCVDNLPALLIPKFIDLCQGYKEEINRIALGVDLRGGQFLQDGGGFFGRQTPQYDGGSLRKLSAEHRGDGFRVHLFQEH